ncbi:MAG: HEAT repeat domain-containing protein, partial [Cyclobacteriaceae bacterium]|nr:HEAT repeat domain-containing protein [Cyclobacteriaceae bacterium]
MNLWDDPNPVYRARAIWLLAEIEGNVNEAITLATGDADENLRITGIKIARQKHQEGLLDFLAPLQNDPSPSVRREVAIALRFQQGEAADKLW